MRLLFAVFLPLPRTLRRPDIMVSSLAAGVETENWRRRKLEAVNWRVGRKAAAEQTSDRTGFMVRPSRETVGCYPRVLRVRVEWRVRSPVKVEGSGAGRDWRAAGSAGDCGGWRAGLEDLKRASVAESAHESRVSS